jgi:aldehyde dehydrogenase (NAD+)
MRNYLKFYIGGEWVDPASDEVMNVENPATEAVCGRVASASAVDVDRAVNAARAAFRTWSVTSREERLRTFERIIAEYQRRLMDIAAAVTEEMGAPAGLASYAQAPIGLGHLAVAMEALRTFEFESDRRSTRIAREPIGVCGLITPWNWPLNQIACKVAPALAVGCTVVLKPSEVSPFSAQVFAEIMHAAGVPPGVFNLVQGTGPVAGAALAAHPEVDMISFTGSTRGGVEVARAAAPTVKRVTQELGGKSPFIVVDGDAAFFEAAIKACVESLMTNSGQSCSAPSRLLVPAMRMREACRAAARAAESLTVGDPTTDVRLGPVVNRAQYDKVQQLIQSGIDEGAKLVTGGPGRPNGLTRGYYVRPTVFGDVSNDMRIAREEIFGPVLAVIPFETVDEAIRIANDTEYGLAAYVQASDIETARKIGRQLRAGQVLLNGASFDLTAPFGGYKHSGNGRECGDLAFHEYLEIKAMLGHTPVTDPA